MRASVILFLLLQLLAPQLLNGQVLSPAPAAADSIGQKLKVEVTTLMEISRKDRPPARYQAGAYPESGSFEIVADDGMDSFRVRANHSFIVSVYDPGNRMPAGYLLEPIKEYSGYYPMEICTVNPLSALEQYLSLNCYCSTDQWFRLRRAHENGTRLQLVYTATSP